MKGYSLFVEKMNKLSMEDRNKIVERIFGLKKVIFYFLNEEDEKIVFRVYNEKKYTKINIIFKVVDTQNFSEIRLTDISLNCDIFIENFVDDGSYFSKFIKILLDGDVNYFDSFL